MTVRIFRAYAAYGYMMMIYGYVYQKKTFKPSNLLEYIEVLYPVTQAYMLNRLIYYIILPY